MIGRRFGHRFSPYVHRTLLEQLEHDDTPAGESLRDTLARAVAGAIIRTLTIDEAHVAIDELCAAAVATRAAASDEPDAGHRGAVLSRAWRLERAAAELQARVGRVGQNDGRC